jgi:hypothetical protein
MVVMRQVTGAIGDVTDEAVVFTDDCFDLSMLMSRAQLGVAWFSVFETAPSANAHLMSKLHERLRCTHRLHMQLTHEQSSKAWTMVMRELTESPFDAGEFNDRSGHTVDSRRTSCARCIRSNGERMAFGAHRVAARVY